MSDLATEIENMARHGLTIPELAKIHEIQVLGEDIVAEGRSAIADLLFREAMRGYSEAIEMIADVDPYTDKEAFYRAQRDIKRFRDMVRWISDVLVAAPLAREVLDEVEENRRTEEDFDDNRQASYPDS